MNYEIINSKLLCVYMHSFISNFGNSIEVVDLMHVYEFNNVGYFRDTWMSHVTVLNFVILSVAFCKQTLLKFKVVD